MNEFSDNSIRPVAHAIWEARTKANIPGTAETDWQAARVRISNQLLGTYCPDCDGWTGLTNCVHGRYQGPYVNFF